MSSFSDIFGKFEEAHPEEYVNGTLKVCIGGGAGFIGSHIAQRLKQQVKSVVVFFLLKFSFSIRVIMLYAQTGKRMSS